MECSRFLNNHRTLYEILQRHVLILANSSSDLPPATIMTARVCIHFQKRTKCVREDEFCEPGQQDGETCTAEVLFMK